MKKPKILLVDDDPGLLRLVSIRLQSAGYDVESVEDAEKALIRLSVSRPDVVVTDLRMDGMDGMALFEAIYSVNPTLPVIILTAHGTIPEAVDATQKGVFSFLTKPFDSKILLEHIEKALQLLGEHGPDQYLEADGQWRQDIITRNSAMEDLLTQARLYAQSDVSVFIRGASGSGKELIAKAIHKASPRRDKPFVAINCSALPEALLESELFGHREGAFTGATKNHDGLFQAASGGTLFLDEVGDMPLLLQAKLLRTLQEQMVRPVGATKDIAVDVRVISATHKDLDQEKSNGTFREDLYYRLDVASLEVPPLANRRDDIPLLAQYFLELIGSKSQKKLTVSPEAMELLMTAQWPGNIRQLRNVMEQVAALATTPIIPPSLVQRALRNPATEILTFAEAKNRFERNYLIQILQLTGGKVSQAARLAKRNRTDFYKLLNRHNLEAALFKTGGDVNPEV